MYEWAVNKQKLERILKIHSGKTEEEIKEQYKLIGGLVKEKKNDKAPVKAPKKQED